MMTNTKICRWLAPRHSAARCRAIGARHTPAIVLMRTMNSVPQKMRKYFDNSPIPNQMTAIGIMAVGERYRKSSMIGSNKSCSKRIRPSKTPPTMPTRDPTKKPTSTLLMLIVTSARISPLIIIGIAVRKTSSGGGMRNGLKRTVERNCQPRNAINSDKMVSRTVRWGPLASP